jgi:hypothetical protein
MTVQEVDRSQFRPLTPAQPGRASHYAASLESVAGVVADYRTAADCIDADEQAKLFDAGGQPRYQPEEQQRQAARFQTLRDEQLTRFRARLDDLDQDAQTWHDHAEKVLTQLAADPVELLLGADQTRASSLREHIADKAAALAVPALVEQMGQTVALSDRATAALYHTYGTRRLEAERQRGDRSPDSPVLAALSAALEAIDGVLYDDATRARRRLHEEKRHDAEQLRRAVRHARHADPAVRAEFGRLWGIRVPQK